MTKKPETKTERLLTQILAAVNALKPGEPVQITIHNTAPKKRVQDEGEVTLPPPMPREQELEYIRSLETKACEETQPHREHAYYPGIWSQYRCPGVPSALQQVKKDAESYARRQLTEYGRNLSQHIAKGFDVALPAEDDMGHPQEGQNYTAPIGAPLHPHVPEGPVDKGDGRTFWQDAKDFRDRQIALEEAAQAVDKIRRIEALMELPVINKLPAIRRILKGEDDAPAAE